MKGITVAAGEAGDRLEFDTRVDWRAPRTLMKASFPLAFGNDEATYDLGLGTVRRGNNRESLYEVLHASRDMSVHGDSPPPDEILLSDICVKELSSTTDDIRFEVMATTAEIDFASLRAVCEQRDLEAAVVERHRQLSDADD